MQVTTIGVMYFQFLKCCTLTNRQVREVRDVMQDSGDCPSSDDLFDEHDENGDDVLDRDELTEAMLELVILVTEGCQTEAPR